MLLWFNKKAINAGLYGEPAVAKGDQPRRHNWSGGPFAMPQMVRGDQFWGDQL